MLLYNISKQTAKNNPTPLSCSPIPLLGTNGNWFWLHILSNLLSNKNAHVLQYLSSWLQYCYYYTDCLQIVEFLVSTYQSRRLWNPVWQIKLELASNLWQLVEQNHCLINKLVNEFEVVLQRLPCFFSFLWAVLLNILKVSQAEMWQIKTY